MSAGFIYLFKNNYDSTYKIGFTEGSVENRRKQLLTGTSQDLEIIKTFKTNYPTQLESYLHKIYGHKKVIREWFNLSDEDILKFIDICSLAEKNFSLLFEKKDYI